MHTRAGMHSHLLDHIFAQMLPKKALTDPRCTGWSAVPAISLGQDYERAMYHGKDCTAEGEEELTGVTAPQPTGVIDVAVAEEDQGLVGIGSVGSAEWCRVLVCCCPTSPLLPPRAARPTAQGSPSLPGGRNRAGNAVSSEDPALPGGGGGGGGGLLASVAWLVGLGDEFVSGKHILPVNFGLRKRVFSAWCPFLLADFGFLRPGGAR